MKQLTRSSSVIYGIPGTENDIHAFPFGTASNSINGIPFPEMTSLEREIPVDINSDIIHQFMALDPQNCITMKDDYRNVISMYLARGRDEELQKLLSSLLEIYRSRTQQTEESKKLEASIMNHITTKMNGN